MKSILKKAAFLLAIPVLFSCEADPLGGDNINNNTNAFTHSSIHEWLDDQRPTPETFTADMSTITQWTSPRGSEITIPAGAFQTPSGQPVSGQVTMSFTEVFTKKDMFTTGASTVSNGTLLNSGGAYNITASQNGTALELVPGRAIQVDIPAQATAANMELFTGTNLGVDSTASWQQADSSSQDTSFNTLVYDPLREYYSVISGLGWVNCDAFINDPKVAVNFDLIGVSGLDESNSIVVAYYPHLNSLMRLRTWASSGATFANSEMRNYQLPSINTTVLVISYIGRKAYYGYTTITPLAGNTYPIQMNEVTAADLQDFIDNL